MKLSYLFVIIGVLVVISSVVMLYLTPSLYTPIVQILISLIISSLFYFAGIKNTQHLEKEINQKWIPQAMGSIQSLVTLRANIKNMRVDNSAKCCYLEDNFPEIIKNEEHKSFRCVLETGCDHYDQRFIDIDNQLEDATECWLRFIDSNCLENKCQQINNEISALYVKRLPMLNDPI